MVNFLRNLFIFTLTMLFTLPIFSLISVVFVRNEKLNIFTVLLPEYTVNTIVLMVGVGLIVLIIGVMSAWVITYYSFPGRRFFEVALFLPLSIPGYIVAYVYVNIFGFAGPVQSFLRELFHWNKGDYYFPDVKSIYWGIIIIGFNLYPYVYMLTRTALIMIRSTVAVATTLCCSRYKILVSIVIPAVRPTIVAGTALVLMEVISDFGTPQFLTINTLTTGIYRHWFLLHDKYSACILAIIALCFVFFLIVVEKFFRRDEASYTSIKMNTGYYHRWNVSNMTSIMLIYFICLLPVFMGFILPVLPLIYWTMERLHTLVGNMRFYVVIFNSINIALMTSVITIAISIVVSYIIRNNKFLSYFIRFITMGYAIPNTIIAISVMVLFGKLSQVISAYFFNVTIIGTIVGLLYTYTFSFFAGALGPIESGFNKIPREIDWSSALMGHGVISTCFNVHIPMLKKSILVGFLLVFIETIKELSATLVIRPFNFETMATRIYELVGDERYMDAAPYALTIVIVGLICVMILCQIFQHDKIKENRMNN
ncbi:iron ABC transporter permease [Neoehrlichia mikurensis]|uniref:Iron ABC transporter permease n=2 Tax=Neoehrlichia mikurensis TaxID=89586 RepID=A0A9Q9F332_9RICK|nr:iron ABC transporter permease [Neoehrlichia mikurensis]QXK92180.1 iron ABC transporter permease [Neoehrlichia mikurensis]QXK92635.1 iron ABC transporter permease [Neoehrlichia mikurensis]QXK93873.1 iron ABC transporter permease [Neoehrlichia mikurensis]UTO55130.1 iron ABC transporter permease [Neoehrlichia mikurensis]UTO56050.1 iron ABC transporter permease [Neoehrlichia mikurensis]